VRWVGGLSLARVLPILIFAVPGGLLADMVNRRRLLLVTQSAGGLIAAWLAYVSLSGQATVAILYLGRRSIRRGDGAGEPGARVADA